MGTEPLWQAGRGLGGRLRRFSIFGAISTVGAVIDFAIVTFLTERFGFGAALALALSMLVSGSLVYVLHQRLTFADLSGTDLRRGRWASFLISTTMVYAFRVALLSGLLALAVPDRLALGLALVLSVVLNFAVSRFLIFRKRS